jgi:hypothetical protein
LKKATSLLLAELAIVLVVAGVIAYSLLLPSRSYHFREVSLNFYPNGAVDFSADMTGLFRALGILTLMTMILGLLVGAAMGLGALNLSGSARAAAGTTVGESVELLLKSGFVRNVSNQGKSDQYEITDTGLRFLKEYQDLNENAQHAPVSNARTRHSQASN